MGDKLTLNIEYERDILQTFEYSRSIYMFVLKTFAMCGTVMSSFPDL